MELQVQVLLSSRRAHCPAVLNNTTGAGVEVAKEITLVVTEAFWSSVVLPAAVDEFPEDVATFVEVLEQTLVTKGAVTEVTLSQVVVTSAAVCGLLT